ncbi:carbohydrate ABC transporter permease [Aureibacillus halotolerans]|uniref:Carbohydrate ABC transporter membrane protein 2 (CUT1 family) n=1 Tax=Aureibacillus halotolerans TaxID=1508390 RepID=A0A4R6U4P9_9BACI|nr:carbohydrate ABC transporter permease [Aureibacillus halotolerans]TDQ40686.1 carbohydrate ABC transporter membrane protein 2 (CUT1 family) [Aureibacillus halotolerans]
MRMKAVTNPQVKVKHRSITKSKRADRLASYALLLFWSVLFILPFVWLISTSLKHEADAITYPPTLLPEVFDWTNYREVFEIVDFTRFYMNTIIVTSLTVLGTLLSCSIVAYGFARIKGKGRNVWFAVLLATMMLPPQVTMIPTYLIFAQLDWVNTFMPLIVPAFFGNPFFIFLLRQFFKTVPKELEEAATIDGCSILGRFFRIILPLSVPALITVAILSFMWTWNDFLNPLIYLNDQENFTLALGLQMFKGQLTMLWGPMMAASTMVIMPLVIVFFFAQKYFIEGIATSGIKG